MDKTFYMTYKLEKTENGLNPGYYRYAYKLSGNPVERPCTFSTDNFTWEDCGKFSSYSDFREFFERIKPSPMAFDTMDYVETITYMGLSVPIFCDDYGQCFYCIFNNEVVSFGGFQTEYEEDVKWMIEREVQKRGKNGD